MTLTKFFDDPMVNKVQTLSEKIRQRRAQMLVLSYIYYSKDDNLVSDDLWQKWADELTELQKEVMDIGFYDDDFRGWNGSTGMHLPRDNWVRRKAAILLENRD